jgi:hypothetical protein
MPSPPLPAGIHDLISTQLRALPESSAEVIAAAAVIGRDFDLPLLAHTLSTSSSILFESIEIAITARVIEPVLGSATAFRFSHALLRDVAYESIPRPIREQLHEQVGHALEELYSGDLDEHVEQLAFHFSQAAKVGGSRQAVSYNIRAGERAIARFAHDNAPGHFRLALELVNYFDPPDPRLRCEILIQLGTALNRIGERDAARRLLLRAANVARSIGAPALIAHAALALSPGFFTIEVGTYDRELESLLRDAQRQVSSSEVDLHVRISARLAAESVWSNSPGACETYSDEALRLARDVTDPATKAYALSARHSALWGAENIDRRMQLIREVEALCRQANDSEISLMHQILKITLLLEIGLIDDADTEIRTYAKIARDLQLPHAQWYVSLFAAMRYALDGRFGDSAAAADRFLELGNRVKDRNAPQSFAVHLIFRLWEANALSHAIPALDQLASDYPSMVAWQCAKAFCLSELRRPEARSLLSYLADDNFAKIPNNETREIALTMLAIAAVNVKDCEQIGKLYRLMLPGEMLYTVVSATACCRLDLALGILVILPLRLGNLVTQIDIFGLQYRKTSGFTRHRGSHDRNMTMHLCSLSSGIRNV